MKKEKLRFLALGFFLSALILTVFQLANPAKATPADEAKVAAETSVESQKVSLSKESNSESKPKAKKNAKEESESRQSDEIADAVDSESSASGSSENDTFMFMVHEGQPTSVVIENLHAADLIEDPAVVQEYIEAYDLSNMIQYGSYELSKDMTYQEIIAIITVQ